MTKKGYFLAEHFFKTKLFFSSPANEEENLPMNDNLNEIMIPDEKRYIID
jgi:hypothetical protein